MRVKAGTATVIRGENGAGKSTLALTSGGLLEKAGGELAASEKLADGLGQAPFEWKAGALVGRRSGRSSKNLNTSSSPRAFAKSWPLPPVVPSAAVLSCPNTNPSRIQQRVQVLLERLGLEGGWLTRIPSPFPVARSAVCPWRPSSAASPQVLILDEPTFGQDANTWRELAGLLVEELEQGTAIIAVTHDDHFAKVLQAADLLLAAQNSTTQIIVQGPVLECTCRAQLVGEDQPMAKLGAVAAATLPLITTLDWVSALVIIVATVVLFPLAGIGPVKFLKRAWPLRTAESLPHGALPWWGRTAAWSTRNSGPSALPKVRLPVVLLPGCVRSRWLFRVFCCWPPRIPAIWAGRCPSS